MGDTTKSSNYSSAVVTVASVATSIVARNANRNNIVLFNQSSQNINLWFDTNTTHIFVLPAGQSLQLSVPPQNAINASVATGTASLTVWEA